MHKERERERKKKMRERGRRITGERLSHSVNYMR